MGYNWSGLGNAIGTGFQQGTSAMLENILKQKLENQSMQNKLNWYRGLSPEDRAIYSEMQTLTQNPFQRALGSIAQQAVGGIVPNQAQPQGMPDYNQPQYQGGEIKVRQKSDGQIGMIPFNEFDSKLYERIP